MILKNIFLKRTKKNGKIKQRVFLIDEDNLYFSKTDKTDKISGVLELNCCKLDLLINVESKPIDSTSSDPLFGFRITRNGKILEIYTRD